MGFGRDLRAAIFRRVGSFSAREVQHFGAPSLITRETNDVQQVQMLVLMGGTLMVSAPIMMVGGILMAAREDVGLSWLVLAVVPVLGVSIGLLVRQMVPSFRLMQERIDEVNRLLREQITGVRVVRAFVREDHETRRFGDANAELTDVAIRAGRWQAAMFPTVMIVANVATGAYGHVWEFASIGEARRVLAASFWASAILILGNALKDLERYPEAVMAHRRAVEASRARRYLPAMRELQVRRLGIVSYGEALELQGRLVQERREDRIPDQLLLLEHPHVITLGTSSHSDHVLLDEAERRLLGIELYETGRGGDVTYHGPGQLVGYPILDLKPDRCDLHRYVRDLEKVLIGALAGFGIDAARREGLTGAWVGDEKVAAIGVRVSSGWITSHGFALNVGTDLGFFDAIVPCGIRDHGVTSIERVVGGTVGMAAVERAVEAEFGRVFGRAAVRVAAAATRG